MTSLHDRPTGADRDDTSRFSYYVDDAFYQRLEEMLRDWDEPGAEVDEQTRSACEAFVYREARLLDDGRLNEWLELFTPTCLYFVPAVPGGGDPRREVAIAFDDRRRLEDRVFWLRTGLVWSQIPPSRTRRLLTNVEVFRPLTPADDDAVLVRANFALHEARAGGRYRTLVGWYGYRLVQDGKGRLISLKQVNLIDSEQGHDILTVIL